MPVRHEASILETEYLLMCCVIKAGANLRGALTDEYAEPVCWDRMTNDECEGIMKETAVS
jgi:hypothetical protein